MLNERRDRTSRRISKLEEAAEAYFRWSENGANYIHSAYELAKGMPDRDWVDRNEPMHADAVRNHALAVTLLMIYGPELVPVLEYVRKPWSEGLKVDGNIRLELAHDGQVTSELAKQLDRPSHMVIGGRQRGLNEIATYCRSLANQPIRKARIATPR